MGAKEKMGWPRRFLARIRIKLHRHKPIINKDSIASVGSRGETAALATCQTCGVQLFGYYSPGKYTGMWRWVWVPYMAG